MKLKNLPKYDAIVFLTFEDAKRASLMIYHNLGYVNALEGGKHFMSIYDIYNTIYGSSISYKIVKGSKNSIINNNDNLRYGYFKKPKIYEYIINDKVEGYILEDPIIVKEEV